jgi:hypothetical protein
MADTETAPNAGQMADARVKASVAAKPILDQLFRSYRRGRSAAFRMMFVVVTLWTGLSKSQAVDGIRAFLTPTTICFSGALFQGLVVLAPWQSDRPIGFTLALTGRGRYLRRATRAAHRTAGQGARRHRRLARLGGVGMSLAPT